MRQCKPYNFRELLGFPEDKQIRIAVGTGNPYKVMAVMDALKKLNPYEEFWVENASVPSGVAEQPVGDEIFNGAENRLSRIKEKYPQADIWVSIEAGLEEMGNGHYGNVQTCIVLLRDGRQMRGKSGGYEVPLEWCEKARREEGGMARVFAERFGANKGGTRPLTENHYARADFIAEAVKLAMFGFNW